jgi:hypothetical protein
VDLLWFGVRLRGRGMGYWQTRAPSMLVGLVVPEQGSWRDGFAFCVPSFFVHDVHVRRHVALFVQPVQERA